MQAQLRNYLAWQKSRGFLHPFLTEAPSSTNSETKSAPSLNAAASETEGRWLVHVEEELSSSEASAELLDKILSSLGFCKGEAEAAPMTIVFSRPTEELPFGKVYKQNDQIFLRTYHPATLLAHPALKKQTWRHLQHGLQFLKGHQA